MRVFDCNGNGEFLGLIEGFEWVFGVVMLFELVVVSLVFGV